MKHIFTFLIGILFAFSLIAEEQNELIVTDNGMEMLQWDLDFIRKAQQSIEISAVYLGGTVARELLAAIEKRLSEVPTLQVYILTAPILIEKEDWAIINRLKANYPKNFHLELPTTVAVIWPDVSGIDHHAKLFVVDEKYFSTGGTNLDETACSEGTWTPKKNFNKASVLSHNLPAGMRDQDVVGKGPLAKELRKIFYKFYAIWENYNRTGKLEKDPEKFAEQNHYFEVTCQTEVERFEHSDKKRKLNPEQVRLVICGPHQQNNVITAEYIRLIQEAKEEIIIANLYFCPVEPLFKALLAAVNRGVKITVITNGVSDVAPEYTKFFCWANRIHYVPLFYGKTFHFWDAWHVAGLPVKNVSIFEYHVKDILLHKKMMMIDGKKSVIGSYNFGSRSDMGDYELILVWDSQELSNDLRKVHEKDIRHSRQIPPEDARRWYFDPVKVSLGEIQKRFHGLL